MVRKLWWLGFAWLLAGSVSAVQTITEQKQTAAAEIDLQYPQGFPYEQIDKAVLRRVQMNQQSFAKQLKNDQHLTDDIPGKSGLWLRYQIPFQQGGWLSIRLNFSLFNRGAAHPNHWVEVLNFHKEESLSLADLLAQEKDLEKLAAYCQQALLKKDWADEKWIKEGTAATVDNYQNWVFSADGIRVIFDTYQVAPYVFGPQELSLPFHLVQPLLKPNYQRHNWRQSHD
ncbi:MAG: DUF3298 domain-containing protein [Legionellaceae bacterium]|nr:DUF3298 domain-containing protein [Legionellaceae bacterium]